MRQDASQPSSDRALTTAEVKSFSRSAILAYRPWPESNLTYSPLFCFMSGTMNTSSAPDGPTITKKPLHFSAAQSLQVAIEREAFLLNFWPYALAGQATVRTTWGIQRIKLDDRASM